MVSPRLREKKHRKCRYPGRHVPYRPDRVTLSAPSSTRPKDRERMRKEEARTQSSQRPARLHDVDHQSTRDSSCPDERDGQAGLDASQSSSGQIMLDANESGLEDDTDEVESVILEGPCNISNEIDSQNDIGEVYTDGVEEPHDSLVEVNSKNDTGYAHTEALAYVYNDTREADDNITTDSKTDRIFLPACGIIFLGAVFKKEGSLLVTGMQEYFQEAKEDVCSSRKEEIPVDVQLQSSQKNENTLGDESRDNNTPVRFINRLGAECTLLVDQQNMYSSLHSDNSRKRSRVEDLETEAQEPESKICRLG